MTVSQSEATDLRRADVDVVGAGEIVVFRRSKEAETVRENFQDTFAVHQTVLADAAAKDLEDQVLLLQADVVLNAFRARDLVQTRCTSICWRSLMKSLPPLTCSYFALVSASIARRPRRCCPCRRHHHCHHRHPRTAAPPLSRCGCCGCCACGGGALSGAPVAGARAAAVAAARGALPRCCGFGAGRRLLRLIFRFHRLWTAGAGVGLGHDAAPIGLWSATSLLRRVRILAG